MIIIGCLIGYILGLFIWDKIILPKLEKKLKQKRYSMFLQRLELAKIIGNQKNDK